MNTAVVYNTCLPWPSLNRSFFESPHLMAAPKVFLNVRGVGLWCGRKRYSITLWPFAPADPNASGMLMRG